MDPKSINPQGTNPATSTQIPKANPQGKNPQDPLLVVHPASDRRRRNLILLFILLVIIPLALYGLSLLTADTDNNQNTNLKLSNSAQSEYKIIPPPLPITEWEVIQSNVCQMEIKYPSGWKATLSEHKEGSCHIRVTYPENQKYFAVLSALFFLLNDADQTKPEYITGITDPEKTTGDIFNEYQYKTDYFSKGNINYSFTYSYHTNFDSTESIFLEMRDSIILTEANEDNNIKSEDLVDDRTNLPQQTNQD